MYFGKHTRDFAEQIFRCDISNHRKYSFKIVIGNTELAFKNPSPVDAPGQYYLSTLTFRFLSQGRNYSRYLRLLKNLDTF